MKIVELSFFPLRPECIKYARDCKDAFVLAREGRIIYIGTGSPVVDFLLSIHRGDEGPLLASATHFAVCMSTNPEVTAAELTAEFAVARGCLPIGNSH